MARTLQDILIDANAYIDLNATAPTGTELTTRANYANQAVWEAAAVAQFSEFHQIYELDPTTLASISLPVNFRELMVSPRQKDANGNWSDPFEEIKPLDRFGMESTDKYCYIVGNPASGYTAVFNGLTANQTLSIDFQRFPSGLLTLTDVCELPDSTFVTTKVEAYVLESRNNDRFPLVKADANTKLKNMVGREMKTPNNGTNSVPRKGLMSYSIG
ncbi:MAG: hypothetical protein M0P59_13375 [Gallionella sp.]|jgi:hypothetical protein|nr:hypothetical protein [Gallionella sp.]